jgi:hypothetical protein
LAEEQEKKKRKDPQSKQKTTLENENTQWETLRGGIK